CSGLRVANGNLEKNKMGLVNWMTTLTDREVYAFVWGLVVVLVHGCTESGKPTMKKQKHLR
ncbi:MULTISPECIES: hypothetical protein, partial [unclassified Pseudomonas]|uniref:hypothetical protein n=1 Tax=unclassified Pseudomonas TaxID=196821 RepID=UPI001C496C76